VSTPPLLFLHGFHCDHTVWNPVLRHLEGWVTHAPDLPFHGQSTESVEPSFDALARVCEGWLNDAPVVVGHSLGGMLGLRLALTVPELLRGLVLVDAFPSLKSCAEHLPAMHGPDTPAEVAAATDGMMARHRKALPESIREPLWRTIQELDAAPQLASMQVPVRALYGGRGTYGDFDAPRLATEFGLDRMPACEVRVFPGAGHFLQLERPGELAAAIRAFLM
jgi:pimeloyl-ACP methyl ester carboxylesterase